MDVTQLPDKSGVYLVKLDKPFGANQYYLGSTVSIRKRVELHSKGWGGIFIREAKKRGIGFTVVGYVLTETEKEARAIEGAYKRKKNNKRFMNDSRFVEVSNG